MKKLISLAGVVLALLLTITSLSWTQDKTIAVAPPSLEGTYILVSRDLSDGSVLKPPAIGGLLTFTKKYRNFNIFWKDAKGNPVSISLMASYTLTADKYTENSIFYMENNKGEGLKYELQPMTASSPVLSQNGGISIKFPMWGEPTVTFTGNTATATLEGVFVDHWVKAE